MSVAFESIDASQDICDGCMMPVPEGHVCTPVRLRRARAKYLRTYNLPAPPWTPMIVRPLTAEESCADETESDDEDAENGDVHA